MSGENTLDRVSALKLLTTGGYKLIKQDELKGKIKAGCSADVAILNEDYFTIPDERIKSVSALLTIVDGKIVWGNKELYSGSPTVPEVIPNWSPVKYYGGYQYE